MKISIEQVNRVKNPKGKVLALAVVKFDDVVIVRGIKFCKNGDGEYFVAMPDQKGKDGNYYAQVSVCGDEEEKKAIYKKITDKVKDQLDL